jgi:hypothetical protein
MKARAAANSKVAFLRFCNLAPPFSLLPMPVYIIEDRGAKPKPVRRRDKGKKLA